MESQEHRRVSARWACRTGVFFLLCLAPLWGECFLGGRVPILRDVLSHYHPWRLLVKAFLTRGHLPFWDPFSFCGTPLWANPQVAVLYPLNALFLIIPYAVALSLFLLIHQWAAGMGMAFLLRKWNAPTWACWAGGLSFCLGGWTTTRMEFLPALSTGIWFPWVVFLYEGVERSRRRFVLLCLCLALQILGGHPQTLLMSWLAFLLLIPWISYPRNLGRSWAIALLAMATACSLAAVQFLPSLELTLRSARSVPLSTEEALWGSLSPKELIRFLLPHRFGGASVSSHWGEEGQFWLGCGYAGAVSALAALFGLGCAGRFGFFKRREGGLCVLLLVGFLGATMGFWPGIQGLASKVPWLLRFRWPARWIYLPSLALPLLLGCMLRVVNAWQGRSLPRMFPFLALAVLGAVVWIGFRSALAQRVLLAAVDRDALKGALTDGIRWDSAKGALLLASGIVLVICRYRWRFSLPFCLMVLVLLDLLPFAWGLRILGDKRLYSGSVSFQGTLFPRTLQTPGFQWWNNYLYGLTESEPYFWARRFLLGNRHILSSTASAGGDQPLAPLDSLERATLWASPNLDLEEKRSLLRGMGVVSVRGVSSIGKPLQEGNPQLPSEPLGCGQQLGEPQIQEILDPSSQASFFIARPYPHGSSLECRTVPCVWEPNAYRVRLQGWGAGRLFLRESWDPGWNATGDGKVLPVGEQGTFLAVDLPEGIREVHFKYRPPLFIWGAVLSCTTSLILATLFWLPFPGRMRKALL